MVQAWIWRSGQRGGFDEIAVDQQVIVLGMHMIADLTDVVDRDDMRALVAQAFADAPASRVQLVLAQLYAFRHSIAVGDLVLMLSNKVSKVAIGEVTGEYEYRPKERLHVRSVRWQRDGIDRVAVGADLLRAPASTALYRIQVVDAAERLRSVAVHGVDPLPGVAPAPPAQRTAHEPEGSPPAVLTPLVRLQRNLEHADSLARAGEALQSVGAARVNAADVYRAAWVQGCAALDHWVRQEVTGRALALGRLPSPPPRILALTASLKTAMQPMTGRRRVDRLLREAITRFHGQKAYLQPDAIAAAFSLVADTTDLWQRVAENLKDDGLDSPYDDMPVPEALRQIVRRRNHIAHDYDADPTSPDGKQSLTQIDVTSMLEWLERLANAITAALPDSGTPGSPSPITPAPAARTGDA